MRYIKHIKPIIYIVIATLFISIAQAFWKLAALKFSFTVEGLLFNLPLFAGFLFYAVTFILVLLALKHGELSIVYPILGTSYIWVLLVARYAFNEIITLTNLLGVASIILGIVFITQGSKK